MKFIDILNSYSLSFLFKHFLFLILQYIHAMILNLLRINLFVFIFTFFILFFLFPSTSLKDSAFKA